MASEKALVQWLKQKLKKRGLQWQRIEDGCSLGIPDINFCYEGMDTWIEAKCLQEWPKREKTGVRVTLRPEQVLWLEDRVNAGGRAFVCVQVARDVMLFPGDFAAGLKAGAFDKSEMLKFGGDRKKTLARLLDHEEPRSGLNGECLQFVLYPRKRRTNAEIAADKKKEDAEKRKMSPKV